MERNTKKMQREYNIEEKCEKEGEVEKKKSMKNENKDGVEEEIKLEDNKEKKMEMKSKDQSKKSTIKKRMMKCEEDRKDYGEEKKSKKM